MYFPLTYFSVFKELLMMEISYILISVHLIGLVFVVQSKPNQIFTAEQLEKFYFDDGHAPKFKTIHESVKENLKQTQHARRKRLAVPPGQIQSRAIIPEFPVIHNGIINSIPSDVIIAATQENNNLRHLLWQYYTNFEIISTKFMKMEKDADATNKTIMNNHSEMKNKLENTKNDGKEDVAKVSATFQNALTTTNKIIDENQAKIKGEIESSKKDTKEELKNIVDKISNVNAKVVLLKNRVLENESKTDDNFKNLELQLANLNKKVDEQDAHIISLINNIKNLLTNPITDMQGRML